MLLPGIADKSTIGKIAAQQGVPLARLFSINGLNGKSILRPGQVLRLSP